ncbi:MAG: hypothetical protein GY679_01350 [Mycoplasma sp.]|nr:hypothetical protein [Mycoplasma sp.]
MSQPRITEILENINKKVCLTTNTVDKFGMQDDIDTADTTGALTQKIWPIKRTVQDYIFIDSPIQLHLTSSSGNDSIAGSGAQKISVSYQDSSGIEQFVTLDMAGSGNVNLPDTSYGSFRMKVSQTGASNTNEGTITLEDGSGNIYAIVSIGEGQTQMAVQRIPSDKTGVIVRRYARYGRGGGTTSAEMRLRIRMVDGTIITKDDPLIRTTMAEYDVAYSGGVTVNPGEWVFWEAVSVSANNTSIAAGFDIRYND